MAKENESFELTENELLELLINQLETEQQDSSGFMTMREIARALGKSIGMTQLMMRDLHEQGLIEAGRVSLTNMAGIMRPVPAYRAKRSNNNDL